ncbi:hypothetical protein FC17_GL002725 [Secundilactobacillus paracollinoides DSM 15502 = JCM 11969]|nr:hypothetical protein FC17_GL002725 [Secundilactobacillus paracollinoides DSM 15502 = JCM 11969]
MDMKQSSLKFTTLFGVIVIVIGVILEVGALFYHVGSLESAEIVFTGAIAVTVGHAFFGLDSLTLSLVLTTISSLGVGYFVLIQTHLNWLWAIIAFVAFYAFILSMFKLRDTVRHRHQSW